MHRVFISYHHANDEWAKIELIATNEAYNLFADLSVNSGDIDDTNLTDEQIRLRVRDDYLRDSTVTIVLVGVETRYRKHVDWELYSSMRDGNVNKKSGVILVPLPSTGISSCSAAHGDREKKALYPDVPNWISLDRKGYETRYPGFSTRMIDNLLCPTAKVSVTPWDKISDNPENLTLAIDLAYNDRESCDYDLSTPMRRRNGSGARI